MRGRACVLVGFGTGNEASQVATQEELAQVFAREHAGASVSFDRIPHSSSAAQKFTVRWDTGDWTYDKLVEIATALTRDGRGRTPDVPGFDAGDVQQFGLGHWDTGIMVDLSSGDLPTYGTGNAFRWDLAAWPRGPERTAATLDLDVGTIPTASRSYDLGWALRDFLTVPRTARALATKGYGAIPALESESAAFVDAVGGRFPGIDLRVLLRGDPVLHAGGRAVVSRPSSRSPTSARSSRCTTAR